MGKYNKPSDVLVLDLINATNIDATTQASINITSGQVTFGKPTVVAPAEGIDWNTLLLCTANRSSPYVGSVNLNYDRMDIGKLFKNIAVNLDVKGATTTLALIDRLNARYGLSIDPKEVVSSPVPALTEAAPVANATITIADTSLVYFGKIDVTVGEDAQVGERLNLVITKTRLDGIHYPVDGTDKGQAYVYSYGVDCNSIRTFLQTLSAGVDVDDSALATQLNKVVPELWIADDAAKDYNVSGSVVKYVGATSVDGAEAAKDANTTFNHVAIITLSDTLCSNFTGDLYLHFNA